MYAGTNARMADIRKVRAEISELERVLPGVQEQLANARADLDVLLEEQRRCQVALASAMKARPRDFITDGYWRSGEGPAERDELAHVDAQLAGANAEVTNLDVRRWRVETCISVARARLAELLGTLTPGQRLQAGAEAPDLAEHKARMAALRARHGEPVPAA